MAGDGSLQTWLDAHQNPKYIHYFCGCDLGRKRDPSTLAIMRSNITTAAPTYLLLKALHLIDALHGHSGEIGQN